MTSNASRCGAPSAAIASRADRGDLADLGALTEHARGVLIEAI